MPLSVNVSTGLVKGRFGSGVKAGPNGEKLLVPARGRIDFEPVAPYVPYPTGTPSAFTILRKVITGILDSEGYLCTPHPDYPDVPGVRGLELYSPDDPQAGVQGWTWKGTPRFVNADGTRLHNTMEPFTFDLPYGEEVDLVNVVDMPQSPGIGKEQAIILAASAQAAATSAAGSAEAAAADAKVARESVATAVEAASAAVSEAAVAKTTAETAAAEAERAVADAGLAVSEASTAKTAATTAVTAATTAATAAERAGAETAAAKSAATQAATDAAEVKAGNAALATTISAATTQQVPPLVAQAIAADETVAAAAGAAVGEALGDARIALKTDPGMPASDKVTGLSFAVTDTHGNRTRLEANDRDGGPTEHSLSLDGPALRDYMGFITEDDTRVPTVAEEEGLSFLTTDAEGRHLWLQANDRDGGPTEFTLDILRRALGLDAPKVETVEYVTDGDSITQGGHGGGPSWQEELSKLMGGTPITNSGISGTTSLEIALRQGAWAPILTIPGGQLPAAAGTRVPVVLENMPNDANFWSDTGQPARTYTGTFEGVPVTLTKVKDTTDWTLHRTTSGTAVKAVPRTPFLMNTLPQSATRIIWPGRNDSPKSNIREPIDRMARWVTDGGGKFLILSVLSRRSAGDSDPDTQEVAEQNRITQEKYPNEYVNVREFLIRYGMEVAGVTPTAEDLSDQAKNAIPRSLMADNVHPNAAGRLAIGRYLYTQLKIRNLA